MHYNFIKQSNKRYLEELNNRWHEFPVVSNAVNIMQRTEWVINRPVFDVLDACVKNSFALGKLPINPDDIPLPPKPFDIATNKEAKTKWKREASNVYKERAKAKSKFIQVRQIQEEAKLFLDSKIKYLLPDPKSFKDVEKAAKRLISAINQGHKIAIFSDYDVDGAASGALLNNWLRDLGVPCTIYIPDRIREGFGPNITAMEKLSKTHDLIICLDCGTVAFESILAANPTDVIIVDHHLAEENLPEAFAIINPSRQDETGNFKYLCATAMVFILLVEANTQLKNDNVNAPNLLKFLDLVALATIADVAPLIGLNRAFVKQGLLVIANRTNPGLSALSDVCQLTSKPSAYDLGFLLGPRINAGGRIGNSKLGVELLIAQTEIEAELIASKLNKLNVDRREIEKKVLHEVRL